MFTTPLGREKRKRYNPIDKYTNAVKTNSTMSRWPIISSANCDDRAKRSIARNEYNVVGG